MKFLRFAAIATGVVIAGAAAAVIYGSIRTERDIAEHQAEVARIGVAKPAPPFDPERIADAPEPVKRYFGFVFAGAPPRYAYFRYEAEGQFRRPLSETFNDATAEQVIAVGTPALMFSATTTMAPGLWARAYDYFAGRRMEMKAKVLSTVTVVDERESPRLNEISLRRWLLESALYPQALLPGGPVTWEPIDRDSARATVVAEGLSASMIAHFDAEGRMTHMVAEEDGDLTTPYHGSGEHVARGDYRAVGNLMIPHEFTVSRRAGGELHPFWRGRITSVQPRTD